VRTRLNFTVDVTLTPNASRRHVLSRQPPCGGGAPILRLLGGFGLKLALMRCFSSAQRGGIECRNHGEDPQMMGAGVASTRYVV
jgi:hypothetical protein